MFLDNLDDESAFDPNLTPAKIFERGKDPAAGWPGAPPNFGQENVPQIFTVSGLIGLAGRAYLAADEALQHSIDNSRRMKVDCGIMESLEARMRATALLNWHIEPEIPDSIEQKQLVEEMTAIVNRTYRFMQMRQCLLNGLWYGRYATALQFESCKIKGKQRKRLSYWEPRNGDKLVFRYDDGSGDYTPGQVGIRIGAAGMILGKLRGTQVQATESGMVYWFNREERKRIIVHKHMIEDGDFDDPYSSGAIHGVGIRSRIYWTWYAMVECLQRVLEYLDRSAFGVELWRYPANNPLAKKSTEEAATRQVGGGRSIILVPSYPAEQGDQYGVEHIEPGLAGVDKLLSVIKEFFGHKIKRYILGQTLTSEAEATGLGSGVAEAHMATFADVVAYDARNLEETLTDDFLRNLQLWNFPKSDDIYLRFVIDTESPNVQERLQALKSAWDMGMAIKDSDIADAAGISVPTERDSKVFNPQLYAAIQQMQQGGMMGGGMPPSQPGQMESIIASVLQSSRQRQANEGPLNLADDDLAI